MSVSNIFNVFVRHLDVPGTSNAYRGDNGNIVVYETRAEAEAAAVEFAAANQNPNISFIVTEFEPTD
jgi:CobQ-like glutamine amidotransferase family enzyme